MDAANFRYEHPLGILWGFIGDRGLRHLWLPRPGKTQNAIHLLHSAPNVVLARTLSAALDSYFAGMPHTFDKIPLDLKGATPFQRKVWHELKKLKWGTTSTYGELARKAAGTPLAARAVGNALGANPIPILIPCHRILAADGRLGGFSAGLEWKQALLRIEGVLE